MDIMDVEHYLNLMWTMMLHTEDLVAEHDKQEKTADQERVDNKLRQATAQLRHDLKAQADDDGILLRRLTPDEFNRHFKAAERETKRAELGEWDG